jgi:hypothetical protein
MMIPLYLFPGASYIPFFRFLNGPSFRFLNGPDLSQIMYARQRTRRAKSPRRYRHCR